MTNFPAAPPNPGAREPLAGEPLAAAMEAFDQALAERYLVRHGVVSPLGLWLLLATVSPLAALDEARELRDALGLKPNEAAPAAANLIATPHPALGATVALWRRRGQVTPGFRAWTELLPPAITTGEVPTPAEADAWADRGTSSLISRFPLPITELTSIVLASALATDVTWKHAFTVCPSANLRGPWAERVRSVLRAPAVAWQGIVDTEAAGTVACHRARSVEGLDVLSVLAAPEVAPAQVHAALREVNRVIHVRSTRARQRTLYELPLRGHAWEIEEVADADCPLELFDTYLPAWEVTASHDLTGAPGMDAALRVLRREIVPGLREASRVEARQSALARFTARGFQAAAVTGLGLRGLGGPEPAPHLPARRATLRFNRPYAVLASVTDGAAEPWRGMPVFSAWVAEPMEAE
jgi:hypothetical protein